MPSTWSDYKIQLMATGENLTTWGDITNENFASFSEMITGSADVTFASGTVTLTLANSTATQTARNLRLNLIGTSGGAQNLVVPAIEKLYLVNNGCADAITVKNSTGTGIAVPAGKTMWVFNNATNVVDVANYFTTVASPSAVITTFTTTTANITTANITTANITTANITTLNLSAPLSVAQGGTGAATLTGLVKGNGTGAFTAATAGTEYVAPGTTTTFTAEQIFIGSSSIPALSLTNAQEPVNIVAGIPSSDTNFDFSTQSIKYFTTNASAVWTVNFRQSSGTTLNSVMAVGQCMSATVISTQNSASFYNNTVQVDGTATGVTVRWINGAPTAGSASGLDVYTYSIMKTASTPTYTILAAFNQFKA